MLTVRDILFTAAILGLGGCVPSPQISTEHSALCTDAGQTNTLNLQEASQPVMVKTREEFSRPVTWYGLIQPMLTSRTLGKKYQCTTCHIDYKEPATILKPGEITRMVDSMRGSGGAFMPRIGDEVPTELINALVAWGKNPLLGRPEDFKVFSEEFNADFDPNDDNGVIIVGEDDEENKDNLVGQVESNCK